MNATSTLRFCPSCGAARSPDARFCGVCGASLAVSVATAVALPVTPPPLKSSTRHSSPPPIPASRTGQKSAVVATGSTAWKVSIGDVLPAVGSLFPKQTKTPRAKKNHVARATAELPIPKAKALWGSTFFMALSQGADMVTRAMEGGTENDKSVHLRLGIAAAVAVFGVALGSSPRLRTVLVKLGTVAIALLQGSSIFTVLQSVATDPQLIQSVIPNVGAQLVSLMAVFRLFREVGKR